GVGVADHDATAGTVKIMGVPVFPNPEAELFLGNAGTAFRPLTATLAVQQGRYTLDGIPRMRERPIGELVDALRALGARIEYLQQEGYPPLRISPADGFDLAQPVRVQGSVSSQFLTALLLAAPLVARAAGRPVVLEVEGELISKPYIEITLNLMRRFGVAVQRQAWQQFTVPADARYVSPGRMAIEGDASSASYFLALGTLGGGPVRVTGVGA